MKYNASTSVVLLLKPIYSQIFDSGFFKTLCTKIYKL